MTDKTKTDQKNKISQPDAKNAQERNPFDTGTKERQDKEGGLIHEPIEIDLNVYAAHNKERTRPASPEDAARCAVKVIGKRARAAYPSTLHWYFSKGSISQRMLEAGTIFAYWYFRAGYVPSLGSCLDRLDRVDGDKGDGELMMGGRIDAKSQIRRAYDILDEEERDVIRCVAGLDERAGNAKRVNALKTGLRALIVYYKIPISQSVFAEVKAKR